MRWNDAPEVIRHTQQLPAIQVLNKNWARRSPIQFCQGDFRLGEVAVTQQTRDQGTAVRQKGLPPRIAPFEIANAYCRVIVIVPVTNQWYQIWGFRVHPVLLWDILIVVVVIVII